IAPLGSVGVGAFCVWGVPRRAGVVRAGFSAPGSAFFALAGAAALRGGFGLEDDADDPFFSDADTSAACFGRGGAATMDVV
ncbi:MAG TPA: hypothetical protein VG125_14890, partial [Pirellulales bacterium]|nr:hypothetical protein [Pirellulales bacterium]